MSSSEQPVPADGNSRLQFFEYSFLRTIEAGLKAAPATSADEHFAPHCNVYGKKAIVIHDLVGQCYAQIRSNSMAEFEQICADFAIDEALDRLDAASTAAACDEAVRSVDPVAPPTPSKPSGKSPRSRRASLASLAAGPSATPTQVVPSADAAAAQALIDAKRREIARLKAEIAAAEAEQARVEAEFTTTNADAAAVVAVFQAAAAAAQEPAVLLTGTGQ